MYGGRYSFLIFGFYRTPIPNVRIFIDELQNFLIENFSKDFNVIFTGYFNIDLYSKSNYSGDFINRLLEKSLVSLLSELTRCKDISSTLIDHIWSNMDSKLHYFVFRLKVNDNFLTLASFKAIKKNTFTIKKIGDQSALSISRFGTMFQGKSYFDTSGISTSTIDELMEKFTEEVVRIYNTSTHRLLNPWLTDEKVGFAKFKRFLVSQVNSNYIHKYIHTNFKQELHKKIDASRKSYYSRKFKVHKNYITKAWNDLKNISGLKSSCTMAEIALTDHNNRSFTHE